MDILAAKTIMQGLLVQARALTLGALLHCRELFGPTQFLCRNTGILLLLDILDKTVICRNAVIEHLGRTVQFQRHW